MQNAWSAIKCLRSKENLQSPPATAETPHIVTMNFSTGRPHGNKTSDTFDSPCGTLSLLHPLLWNHNSCVYVCQRHWWRLWPSGIWLRPIPESLFRVGRHQTKRQRHRRRLVWKILSSMGVIKSRWQFNQQSAGENVKWARTRVKPFQKSNQMCLRRLPRWWLNFMSLCGY